MYRRFIAVLFGTFLFVGSAFANPLVTPNSASFDFGRLPVSSNALMRSLSFVPSPDVFPRVKSVRWRSGANPASIQFSNLPAAGDIVLAADTFDFTATFQNPEYLSDALIIEFTCGDGNCEGQEQVVEIQFSAKVDCAQIDANCAPKGPECVVDFNSEPYVQFSMEDYEDSVRSRVSEVVSKHYGGYQDYTLPFGSFLGLLGMDALFDVEDDSCCKCGGTCLPEVKFTIDFNYPNSARFVWESEDGLASTLLSKSNPFYDVEVNIPSKLTGSVYVGASYVEVYYSNSTSAPQMSFDYIGASAGYPSGTKIYDGHLLCSGASLSQTVIRHPDPSGKVPAIHLRVAEEIVQP